MIETIMIKRESTKKLISSIESLQVVSVFNFKETEGYVEIMFRVNKESSETWLSLIDRLIGIHENISVNKKYLLKDGRSAFAWSITVASDQLDTDIDYINNVIQESIIKSKPQKTSETIKTKKLFDKKPEFNKPIYANPEAGITVWEIALSNTSSDRNKPKVLEDGTPSTKGAFTLSDKGKKEWSKAVGSLHRRGTIR